MISIAELLDLEDEDIRIIATEIDGNIKRITLDTVPHPQYCPECSFRMHSRGIKTRTIQHPILQDGYSLELKLRQRRWRCTNESCRYEVNEQFRFVRKNRRSTNATDIMIIEAFKDLNTSAATIARRFHSTDTHVLDVFDRYIKMDRLPLTDIISVDEVHIDIDAKNPYALVIQDFYTGDPIDLLRARTARVTTPYFANIPPEERNHVRYLLSDMYNPYLKFVDKYFPNAKPVVDSFHVIQFVNGKIDAYIRSLATAIRKRDREKVASRHPATFYKLKVPVSNELYLLNHYRWLILASPANRKYYDDLRMDRQLRVMMNTYDYERELFKIDPRLSTLRDLKDEYIAFNNRNAGNPIAASSEIDELIKHYRTSEDEIFTEFARVLRKFKEPIINSFIMEEKQGPGGLYDARLSNGPIESLNRKVKDLKRIGRGYRNFEHLRNRFLYATRKNPILNGIPDSAQVLYLDESDDF